MLPTPHPRTSPTWLLDSDASHHVTTDLQNLSLHSPYSESNDVMIGDDTGLPITHIGSSHLSSPTSSFTLFNVLCVPTMKRNLISVYQFCVTNNVYVEFLPSLFFVKDLQTRAILFQGNIKDRVYEYLISTIVYLINRMPTPTLNLSSPFKLIFKIEPNYSRLKSFGRLCYPWIRPYSSHTLEPKSKPCVFIGYSLSQYAYLCFEPSTSKTFVSCHIKFVESIFPYTNLHSMLPHPTSTSTVSWLPPILTVSVPLPSHLHSYTLDVPVPELPPVAAPSPPPLSAASPTPHSPVSQLASPPPPRHSMTTHAKNNILKPIQKLNFYTPGSQRFQLEKCYVKQVQCPCSQWNMGTCLSN